MINSASWIALFIALFGCDVVSATGERPNVIVVFTDDHGYADLSCQGVRDDVLTPHIDALAAGGARMTSGYVTAPQCVPSRAGLLTGRYQNRFSVESNGVPLDGFDRQLTIAERLKKAGYVTGMIGKWHLGSPQRIEKHGFDDVFYQGGTWTNFDISGQDVRPGTKMQGMYHIDAGSAAAKAFITRHHDEPFFLYVAYRAPHVPLDAISRYLSRFPGHMPERRRQALAMIAAVDDGVGGIMESLREYGLEDNTLVFFIGDNGAPLKIHKQDIPGGGPGWDGSLNEPLNGEKGMLTEGGIRVPFVVAWKGKIPAGLVCDSPVSALDVTATACSLAGLPHDPKLDGVNLIPLLCGNSHNTMRRALYWRWIDQAAIREGRWKYLRGGDREYLFDLNADPEEKNSLLDGNPVVAQRLSTRLRLWADGLRPPGLTRKSMADTPAKYYDFYLDGKPAPPAPPVKLPTESTEAWVARRCTVKSGGTGLVAAPIGKGSPDGDVYITMNRLNLPPAFRIEVTASATTSGKLSVEWRQKDQKDFVRGARQELGGNLSAKVSTMAGTVSAKASVIHIRVLFPATGITIETITLKRPSGGLLHHWDFRSDRP